MKFSDALGCLWIARSKGPDQVLGLVLEVVKIRIRRKRDYGHDELPFSRLIVRICRQKVSSRMERMT
jgi:hypothetical protein